jgi:phosphoribosyl 1,2-cyclic phosphodiesterase
LLVTDHGQDYVRDDRMQFSVLASGSRGNACVVRTDGPALLIDLGLGPRTLTERRNQVGVGRVPIGAALLTHTHADHVGDAALRWLAAEKIPLYCHEAHRINLAMHPGFLQLETNRLVRHFDDRPWIAPNGMRIEPILLSHDDHPTFGFRVEARTARSPGRLRSLGYLADTGVWTDETAEAVSDVDVLGVEFNHDVELQRNSARPAFLIRRILGDRGHLSNDQGAGLLEAVATRTGRRGLQTVVLLHLSRDCNHPELARSAAVAALRRAGHRARVHVADQDSALALALPAAGRRVVRSASRASLGRSPGAY